MIVEDGTSKTDANSYVSLVEAATYADERAYTDWADATDEAKEAALIKATQYIDANYDFNGISNSYLSSLSQSLAWPRSGAFDKEGRTLTGVPKLVKDACCELARVALTTSLVASPETAAVKREKVKAGSVETETEYATSGGSSTDASPCPYADKLLTSLYAVSKTGLGGGFVAFQVG